MGLCAKACQGLVSLTLLPDDTAEEINRKRMTIPTGLCVLFLVAVAWAMYFTEDVLQAYWVGCLVLVLSLVAMLTFPLVRRRLPLDLVGAGCCFCTVGIILLDLAHAAANNPMRVWIFCILIMDVYLALGVSRTYQGVVLSLTAAWLVLSTAESGLRLGLYDIEGFTEDGGYARERCTCSDPPCATGLSSFFIASAAQLTVLFLDFYATRDFAEGMRAEQLKVWASIQTAEQVAAGLAGFDLEAAERALDAESHLPPRLGSSFHRLIRNLASYRPYLPQSCLEQTDECERHGEESHPEQEHELAEELGGAARSSRGMSSAPDSWADPTGDARARSSLSAKGSARRLCWEQKNSSASPDKRLSACSGTGSQRSGSLSVSDSEMSFKPQPTHVCHAPQHRAVTLLGCNRRGLLAAAQQLEAAKLGPWLAVEIERFQAILKALGGLTDLLSADHFSASFGALRAQGTGGRQAATRAAAQLSAPHTASSAAPMELAALPATAAVCSGRALCGDFGSSAAVRFMVIGGVSALAPAMERCAAAWGTPVLVDSAVHSDIEHTWSCRLRQCARFSKAAGPRPIGLWEVVCERTAGGGPEEWMYELERAQPNPWQLYNEVVHCWVKSGAVGALGLLCERRGQPEGGGVVHAEDIQALERRLREGAAAPHCDLSDLAPTPAPLQEVQQPSPGVVVN